MIQSKIVIFIPYLFEHKESHGRHLRIVGGVPRPELLALARRSSTPPTVTTPMTLRRRMALLR